MLTLILAGCFMAGFSLVLGLFPLKMEARPTLQTFGYDVGPEKKKSLLDLVRSLAVINKPLCAGSLRQRISRDLSMAHLDINPEEFLVFKEAGILGCLVVTYPFIKPDMIVFWIAVSFTLGYMMPEYIVKGRIRKVKTAISRELPDAIDLLALCVNAGLDFMLALKWVVEKSAPSVVNNEFNVLLQEINVGKTRREALRDMAEKYELPDLRTFSRTLIQADKMGTSVSDALNILSEDMRLARFRRGEQIAMKAPLKLLVPLLFFIFPVVGILVGAPIFLQFIETNPMQGLTGG